MKNVVIFFAVVIISSIFLSSCTSKSAILAAKDKATKDSIILVMKEDSIFKKSLYLEGKMYFDGKQGIVMSQICYGFIWNPNDGLSIILFSDFPEAVVPVEIELMINNIIQNKYARNYHHFYSDNNRSYLELGIIGSLTRPLDESLRVIKIIEKETKWQITKNY